MVFIRSIYLFAILGASAFASANDEGADYGLDCSFPIHNKESSCGDLLGDRKAVYEEYMQGCREKWGSKGAKRCDGSEEDRIAMSKRQPQSMVVSSVFFVSSRMFGSDTVSHV
jgi:hypothetical protein